MATTSNDIFDTIGPFRKKWWGLGRKKITPQYSKIANVSDTDEPYMDTREYGGFGVAAQKHENEAVAMDSVVQGVAKRFSVATYATGTQVSREAVKDSKWAEMKKAFASAGQSMEQTPEYLFALFLDRAFNSSYPVLGDNIELCSTVHTLPKGGTYANELTTPASLGESGLEQIRTNLRTMKKTDGMIRPLMAEKIVVPSALLDTATKLANTRQQVGTANNTVSVVAGIEVIPFDYLSSSTRWFALTDANDDDEGLFWKFVERPQNLRENTASTLSALYVSFFRAYWGCTDGRAIYGSAATA